MLKKFTITDKLLFISAFLSLIFSEILYFEGSKDQAIFIGLWVPSILAFDLFKKLIQKTINMSDIPLLCSTYNSFVWTRICFGTKDLTKEITIIIIVQCMYSSYLLISRTKTKFDLAKV
jgi:hypothetical protein